MIYIGHKRDDGTIQSVQTHLLGTAQLAEHFGASFGCGPHALRTGLLHDVGKYAPDVQNRMNDPEHTSKVNHTTAGAIEAMKLRDLPAMVAIACHHGGLTDRNDLVKGKLAYKPKDYSAFQTEITPAPGTLCPDWATHDLTACSMYTRMLFSCLVDADFLDTEAFMQDQPVRTSMSDPLPKLLKRLEQYIRGWYPAKTPINEKRCDILDDCAAASECEPGLFTLTVPTGGGKTISSLMFALLHAIRYGKQRVIYVVPYTSIIEQNARIFQEILGAENVLEHHSGVDYDEQYANGDLTDTETNEQTLRLRQATENWDAPVIVTTAVQFFESLFAAKTSRCRKLHNIAESVVIFDEAQMLPLPFLRPCVYAIAELVRHYRTSAVLCTATQPALDHLLAEYLPGQPAREIVRDRDGLYDFFRRVTYRLEGPLEEHVLLDGLCSLKQSLCIVNTRKTAQRLYDQLPEEGRYHLSTWMTPRDRRRIIQVIRKRLEKCLPCRVISTSLIEAGVDLDFPTVWREEAGLDSILQAGGRCNREGKQSLAESMVHIFSFSNTANVSMKPYVDAFHYAIEDGRSVDELTTIHRYFLALLKSKGAAIDHEEIMRQGEMMAFQTIAERFRLIDDSHSVTLYIPTEGNVALLDALREGRYTRRTIRSLQHDSISITKDTWKKLVDSTCLEITPDGFSILTDSACYDPDRGLAIKDHSGQAIFC